MALLQKILQAALRARMASRAAPGGGRPSMFGSRADPRASTRRSVGGCLMRLVLVVVLLFVALAGAAFMFGQFMLQGS